MNVRLIPNGNLRVGMQTMIPNPKGGYFKDVRLERFFVTSLRFPYIAFETSNGKVIYSPCGSTHVLV